MGRSLSNLTDGEFDALVVTDKVTANNVEAQGDFAHTGENPAEFQDLHPLRNDFADTRVITKTDCDF